MTRTIKVGDFVSVHWSDRDVMYGIVDYVPGATGDMWYIWGYRTPSGPTAEGRSIAINPTSKSLDYIMKILGENALKEELLAEKRTS